MSLSLFGLFHVSNPTFSVILQFPILVKYSNIRQRLRSDHQRWFWPEVLALLIHGLKGFLCVYTEDLLMTSYFPKSRRYSFLSAAFILFVYTCWVFGIVTVTEHEFSKYDQLIWTHPFANIISSTIGRYKFIGNPNGLNLVLHFTKLSSFQINVQLVHMETHMSL